MPDGSWRKRDAACPFYRHDKEATKEITCEGVFDRSKLTHKFRRQRDREQQLTLFCAADFTKCEIYRAIMEAKYPDD